MTLGKNLPEPQLFHLLNVRDFCPVGFSGLFQGSDKILYIKVFGKL